MSKTEDTKKQGKAKSFAAHRTANIIVIVIASLAALILIAVAVLSLVKINPNDKLERPVYYDLYNVGETSALSSDSKAQSNISAALDDMKFSVMSAILEGHWDYSLSFKRNASDEKIELSADELSKISATETEYMIEFVYAPAAVTEKGIDYSTAHSLTVDGETVYFDRIKVLVGDTAGSVGTISLYPYITARIGNQSDVEGISSDTYKVTGINIRANTTNAYASIKDLVSKIKANIEI